MRRNRLERKDLEKKLKEKNKKYDKVRGEREKETPLSIRSKVNQRLWLKESLILTLVCYWLVCFDQSNFCTTFLFYFLFQ